MEGVTVEESPRPEQVLVDVPVGWNNGRFFELASQHGVTLSDVVPEEEDLQQLLNEVRSYASPIVLDCTECRLAALWREAWGLLQAQRHGRQAQLVDDSCDASLTIRADRFRMVTVSDPQIGQDTWPACISPSKAAAD